MADELNYRSVGVSTRSPSTLNDNDRSLDFVITTETPVPMYDWESGDVVPEVLLAKGCVMPRQVPLLDTHSRWSTSDVLGSVRNRRVEDGAVVGTAFFSATPRSAEAFEKYKEGHLTDFSAGYRINDVTRVKKGEKVEIDGRSWKGPVNVVTSWTLKEASCCPIGADAKAKARSDQPFEDKLTNINEESKMDENQFNELRGTIEALATGISTLVEYQRAAMDKDKVLDDEEKAVDKMRRDAIAKPEIVQRKERERIQGIDMIAEKMRNSTGIDFEDLRAELIENGVSIDEARQRFLDRIATAKPTDAGGMHVFVSKDERDKSREGAIDGLMIRSGIAVDKVSDNQTEYQTMSLLEMAKNRMLVFGQSVRGLDQMEIFKRAMNTSDFANILSDVANKAMLEGFENAEETYDVWADTTGRVNDFKEHVFARASEAPSLVEVNPDGGEYTYGKVTDKKESVTVVDYGIIVPFTRKAMVNDDLGALADIREKLGAAARRKYGDLVYAVLTGNPTMGDSKSLFHADHSNYVTSSSGSAPSVTNLNTAAAAMATQKDIQGIQNLNVRPIFIIAPWALKGTIDNLLVETSPVAPGTLAAPVRNPWSYLQPVYDARIDASVATEWFLAARKGMTVKLFTLNGNMTPMLETREGWAVDGMEFKARVTAAAKAVDYRGLYMNYGA